jgi:hypothetical protein
MSSILSDEYDPGQPVQGAMIGEKAARFGEWSRLQAAPTTVLR